MKVIIIGAHPEAKELINRISSGWNISVVDIDQEVLRNFSTNRQIEKIQGDGTSNLVLKKAGIEQANAVITLTKNDEVNLEVLKLAKQNNILRISSIVNNVSNLDEYKKIEAEVVEPSTLIARRFEYILEPRRVVSQAFAGGRAEAIEIEISADSPVRGKKLKEIGSDYFIVGALFRKGTVVIPHGDTEIETGDLVTIVLQSGAFANVINLFSGSESRFPLEFGKDIAVSLENENNLKNLSESEYFVRNTKASSLKIISKPDIFNNNVEPAEDTFKAILKDQEYELLNTSKSSVKTLSSLISESSVGTWIVPVVDNFSKSKVKNILNLSLKNKVPVLFSKLSYPYKKIGILVNDNFDSKSSNPIAFDLAASLNANLFGLNISQPKFLQSEHDEGGNGIIEKLHDLALSHEVQLDIENVEGNEAKIFSEKSPNFDLAVIGSTSSATWQERKTVEYIVLNSKSSVLYIPG